MIDNILTEYPFYNHIFEKVLVDFFLFIMILKQRSCTNKDTTSVVRGGLSYRENKKRFGDWVGVEDNCGCRSS